MVDYKLKGMEEMFVNRSMHMNIVLISLLVKTCSMQFLIFFVLSDKSTNLITSKINLIFTCLFHLLKYP